MDVKFQLSLDKILLQSTFDAQSISQAHSLAETRNIHKDNNIPGKEGGEQFGGNKEQLRAMNNYIQQMYTNLVALN